MRGSTSEPVSGTERYSVFGRTNTRNERYGMGKSISEGTAMIRGLIASAVLGVFSCVEPASAEAATLNCADLARAPIAAATILSAEDVSGTLPGADLVPSRGSHVQPVNPLLRGMPPFCRLKASLHPVKGSNIGIELWLPKDWNGKLLGIGGHGFGGNFERGDMAVGLRRGYAVVTTDMGHTGTRGAQGGMNVGNAEFAIGNEVAIDDFAWRATHEMTVAAKALVTLYYGVAARRSYFDACSNGGRQSMREAQQFPADYDGIIAGSAALSWTGFMAQTLWQYQVGALPSGGRLSTAAIELAHRATVAACDRLDGLADGLIADPQRCGWKADAILCKPGSKADTCLTAEEAAAIERVKAPLRDPATGKLIYPGMEPGSELQWVSRNGSIGGFNRVTAEYYRYMVVRDPNWSEKDAVKANVAELWRRSAMPGQPGARINSINPDLSAFRDRGGKLIQYHGWSDQSMSPGFNAQYYQEVVDLQPGRDRLAKTQEFYRLFMAPGMAHCYGGAGPTNFGGLDHDPAPTVDAEHDVLEALDAWVERKTPPAQLIATEFTEAGDVRRQMPICPYPRVPTYTGGNANLPGSFQCRLPKRPAVRS